MSKQISFGNLVVDIVEASDHTTFTFKGDVGDSFKHQSVPRIKSKKITLDLGGITNFNSCGVREWVYLMRDFSQLGEIVFTNCSIAMVDQFNMVPESLSTGHVESFFAPYVCETHGDLEQLIDVKKELHIINNNEVPERKCNKCQHHLIFDAMPDSYFLFLEPLKNKVNKAS